MNLNKGKENTSIGVSRRLNLNTYEIVLSSRMKCFLPKFRSKSFPMKIH